MKTYNTLIALFFIALIITLTGCGTQNMVSDDTTPAGNTMTDTTVPPENVVVTDVSMLNESDDVDIGSVI